MASYAHEANAQVCLLVQAESREALDNLEAIAAVDGVDGIFIGPADLSASLGYVGNSGHVDVQAAIAQPSTNACGVHRITSRSLNVPGSDSSALQQR